MRTFRTTARRWGVAVALLLVVTTCLALAGEARQSETVPQARTAQTVLADLRAVVDQLAENLVAQEDAWPRRAEDQKNERAPGPRVRALQGAYRSLLEEQQQLQRELQRRAAKELDTVLSVLRDADEWSFVETVLPVVVEAAGDDPRTTVVLLDLSRRFVPWPGQLVDALADAGGRSGSLALLNSGIERRSAALLADAGQGGERVVLESLIDLADRDADRELAQACLDAIGRLVPPGGPDARPRSGRRQQAGRPRELQELALKRVATVRSVALRAALIGYLGRFDDSRLLRDLQAAYSDNSDLPVRLAALGAMGNTGEAAGPFLLAQSEDPDNPLPVRRAAIRALASCRYRPAARSLIDLLDDPDLRRDAVRALRRIAGKSLAARRAEWLRWWRGQPEGKADRADPDA